MTLPPKQENARYAYVRQYSLARILAVWAAAALPMAVLAWLVAPLLGALLGGGDEAFAQALLLCIAAGLIWQFVLTLILVGREQGTLRFSRVRDALWLFSPRDPRSGRVGGRVWLWVIPFVLLFGLWEFFGFNPSGPANRDLVLFLDTRGEGFFRGNWGWFAVVVVLSVFVSFLGEDLLFRGLLLPRMRGVFGGRLRRQRGAVRLLPPAHPLVDPRRPGGRRPHRLPHAAVAERVDEHRRALGPERVRLRHPSPRARLTSAPLADSSPQV